MSDMSECEECDEQPFSECTCEPKFAKPGEKKKKAKIFNRKVRIHAIDKPEKTHCRFCLQPDDGTAYYHHTESPYFKSKYGKGIGTKVSDNLTVWGHHECGIAASIQPAKDAPEIEKIEYDWHWARSIIETHLV